MKSNSRTHQLEERNKDLEKQHLDQSNLRKEDQNRIVKLIELKEQSESELRSLRVSMTD